MASSPTSKILEFTRVKPLPDSPNSASELSLPLNLFDTFWFKFPPVERLFFYQLKNATLPYFNLMILPKLKHSLSLTLLHYLPLAGNLKWPPTSLKPIILYTPDDGVPLTVAQSAADFNLLSSNGVYEAIELHPLTPELITSDDSASVIALQITLFPNMGFCIGITAHHAILDGKTTTLFMKSWAYLCNQGYTEYSPLPPELAPFLDRSVIKDPTGFDLDMLYLNQWDSDTNNKCLKILQNRGEDSSIVRATFNISPEDFTKMRERVLAKSSDSLNQHHLSTFVLTLAYVTSCLVKARGGEGDRPIRIAFTADCRPRLDPPVPKNYLGNCNSVFVDISKARDFTDDENGFAFAAEKVSNMIKGLIEKGVFEGAEEKLKPILAAGKEPPGSVQTFTVAGSPRFDVYGSDFGWGRPCKVEVVSINKNGAISMAESRDGSRGVEVGLALNRHEMERLSSMFLKDV